MTFIDFFLNFALFPMIVGFSRHVARDLQCLTLQFTRVYAYSVCSIKQGTRLRLTCYRAGQDNALHLGSGLGSRLHYIGSALQCWFYEVFLWVGSLNEKW